MGRRATPQSEPVTSSRRMRLRSPAELIEPGRGPERPDGGRRPRANRKVGAFVRFVSGILTVLFVGLVGSGGVALYLYHKYEQPGPLASGLSVTIPKGEGRLQIADRLEREGVISNRWSFLISHMMKGATQGWRKAELKAGEYAFDDGVSMKSVLDTVASGRSVQYGLTIPEGLTSQQIVGRINKSDVLTGELTDVPPEGSLMPATYPLTKGMTRQDLVEWMQREMQTFLDAEWEKRAPDLPINTKEDALILASIVERETGHKGERPLVAGVFTNRLRKKMRLQSDPTIIYGLVGGQGPLGHGITRSEKAKRTAYNTYQINGLPPTPIANPGRAAIKAVLNPASTKDIYFVADGTGGHEFSETLKQHNAAVARWRKIEAERRKKREQQQAVNTRAATVPAPSTNAADGPVDDDSTAAEKNTAEKVKVTTINVNKTRAISIPVEATLDRAKADTARATAGAAGSVPLPERKPRRSQN